jgi:hypothetical protein
MAITRYLVSDVAVGHGERLAVASPAAQATYADLDVRSRRLAAALVARGIKAGDRIVVFMDDCLEAILSIVAAAKMAAVLVPVAADTTAADLGYVLDDCRAAAVVTKTRLGPVTAEAMRRACSVRLAVLAGGDQGSVSETCLSFEEAIGRGTRDGVRLPDGPLAAMLFYPRVPGGLGAPLTLTAHDVAMQAAKVNAAVGAVVDDVRPMAGARGMTRLLAALAQGATIALPAEPAAIWPTRSAA